MHLRASGPSEYQDSSEHQGSLWISGVLIFKGSWFRTPLSIRSTFEHQGPGALWESGAPKNTDGVGPKNTFLFCEFGSLPKKVAQIRGVFGFWVPIGCLGPLEISAPLEKLIENLTLKAISGSCTSAPSTKPRFGSASLINTLAPPGHGQIHP